MLINTEYIQTYHRVYFVCNFVWCSFASERAFSYYLSPCNNLYNIVYPVIECVMLKSFESDFSVRYCMQKTIPNNDLI